jgi:hypothetical protein
MKPERQISKKERTLIDDIQKNLSNVQFPEKDKISKYVLAFVDAIVVNPAYSIQDRIMGLEMIKSISEIISTDVDRRTILLRLRGVLDDLDYSKNELLELLGTIATKTKKTLIDDGWLKKISGGVFILLASLIVILIAIISGEGVFSSILESASELSFDKVLDTLMNPHEKKRKI